MPARVEQLTQPAHVWVRDSRTVLVRKAQIWCNLLTDGGPKMNHVVHVTYNNRNERQPLAWLATEEDCHFVQRDFVFLEHMTTTGGAEATKLLLRPSGHLVRKLHKDKRQFAIDWDETIGRIEIQDRSAVGKGERLSIQNTHVAANVDKTPEQVPICQIAATDVKDFNMELYLPETEKHKLVTLREIAVGVYKGGDVVTQYDDVGNCTGKGYVKQYAVGSPDVQVDIIQGTFNSTESVAVNGIDIGKPALVAFDQAYVYTMGVTMLRDFEDTGRPYHYSFQFASKDLRDAWEHGLRAVRDRIFAANRHAEIKVPQDQFASIKHIVIKPHEPARDEVLKVELDLGKGRNGQRSCIIDVSTETADPRKLNEMVTAVVEANAILPTETKPLYKFLRFVLERQKVSGRVLDLIQEIDYEMFESKFEEAATAGEDYDSVSVETKCAANLDKLWLSAKNDVSQYGSGADVVAYILQRNIAKMRLINAIQSKLENDQRKPLVNQGPIATMEFGEDPVSRGQTQESE
mmetsp:Transcript_22767/g.51866  ORF Transcript_22767/g.51866 Transcript_22767/m.51866 type:complete len:519 (-) Transcript_22767:15-1571(-)